MFKIPYWLIGSILGDTHITKNGQINIGHSIKQKEYFLLKYNKLKNLDNILSKQKQLNYTTYDHLDKRTNKIYTTLSITTLSKFKLERSLFYPDNIKKIPNNIQDIFNEESLAYWYMDDGSKNSIKGKGMVIDISNFNEHDEILIKNMMNNKFSCEVSFHRRSINNTKLYIKASSALHFSNIIRPYIIPSMEYKLTC